MDGVMDLHFRTVPLLKKCLRVYHILSNRSRFPAKVGSWRIDLIQRRSIVISSYHQKRHSERPHTARLCELLANHCQLIAQPLDGDLFPVSQVVLSGLFSGFFDEHSEVSSESRIYQPAMLTYRHYFRHREFIHQHACRFLLSSQDDSIRCLDSERSLSLTHCY